MRNHLLFYIIYLTMKYIHSLQYHCKGSDHMKIKEIEVLTGMSRDNIRFYEKCGLLIPNRNDNGYREYNEDDVNTLKRIKLLRSLHLSIEDIKDIQTNKKDLIHHLDEHIKQLENQKIDLDISTKTCQQMILDHVNYNDLDAQKYLNNFNSNELNEDVIPKLDAPIRRFLARGIDLALYTLIINSLFVFGFHVNIIDNYGIEFTITILSLLLMLFIEPFLLSMFSTTLGKLILGFRIYDIDGNRLSYKEGLHRTLNVIIYGYGLCVPFVTYLCLFSSYRKDNKNETLVWEEDNIQILKHEHFVQVFGVLMFYVFQSVCGILISNNLQLPPNRGELTLYEFCENYNYIAKLYSENTSVFLDENGNWKSQEVYINGSFVSENINKYPILNYVIDNDELIEISFTNKNDHVFASNTLVESNVKTFMSLAYIKAQNSYSIFDFNTAHIINNLNCDYDYIYEINGVEIILDYTDDNIIYTFTIRKK